jgi:hypothetical protein
LMRWLVGLSNALAASEGWPPPKEKKHDDERRRG